MVTATKWGRGRYRAPALSGLVVLLALSGCGSSGKSSTSHGGTEQITYDGQIGAGTAPGSATFVATGAISDSGTLVINGQDTGAIVYTTLTFTGKKGTFHGSEKIIKGGLHTWMINSGTGDYAGLQGSGTESGSPDSNGHIHVVMAGNFASIH